MLLKLMSKTTVVLFLSVFFITPAVAIDNCMVGKWKPAPGQLKQQFEQVSKQQIGKISGQVILNLNKNGSGTYQMQNLTLGMNPAAGGPPMQVTMVMNGSSRFNWSAGNQQFSMKNSTMSLKTSGWMQMGGTKIPLPSMPIKNNQATGIADGGYSCSGNKLVFQPRDKSTVLKVWHRI